MSGFKKSFNAGSGGEFDSGDALVNQAIEKLQGEGFEFRQAMMHPVFTVILMTCDDTQETAAILMSRSGYPQTTPTGYVIDEAQILRGRNDQADMPEPIMVRDYVRGNSGGPGTVLGGPRF